jgi:ring-1,2-phenylacetyl-CoA epoxidase subunit PaaD
MTVSESDIKTEEQIIWEILDGIPDPEVPVLSVNDLGIIRSVSVLKPGDTVAIKITPTYSGCPAMDAIATNIRMVLFSKGYADIRIIKVLSPAWTTNWMSEKGKQKLKAYGIAPPGAISKTDPLDLFAPAEKVQCPLCNSSNTGMISEFGSTSCKSLYRCNDCKEPFDHFKCH